MRTHIKPQCGMFLSFENTHILCFSPERFIRTSKNIIESFPMKGTRPRSGNISQDKSLKLELYNSPKDRAEHLMIVDLIRNDLGKICTYGSINVENLYGIESFVSVHQMVSHIYGTLLHTVCETDIIQALFPGGSITGAPKERSMMIIDLIENYSRNVYTGSLGYISSSGDIDFNIALRTMTITGDIATYPVGGGIVWDSDYIEEWQEAQQKSKIVDMYTAKYIYNDYQLESFRNT